MSFFAVASHLCFAASAVFGFLVTLLGFLELHFSKDSETGRVVIQVRDLDGNVLKTIPPSRALDVMSGAAL